MFNEYEKMTTDELLELWMVLRHYWPGPMPDNLVLITAELKKRIYPVD